MKFGKYLEKRHLDLPEYAPYFMDYKMLKKLMKRLAAEPASDNSEEARYQRLQQHKATFFFHVERELEKVTTFYAQKEADLETRLDLLVQKRIAAASGSLGVLTPSSVAYISIHEGLQRFRRDLDRLEQFVELNATGFSKMLKKWDKRSRSHTKELYLSRAVEVQPMFHRDVLVRLSDRSNACLLEVEALAAGDSLVFEKIKESTPLASVIVASDDLFHEFVNFARGYDSNDEAARRAMASWIAELTTGEDAVRRITQVYLRALSTLATDEALLALWSTGKVDVTAVEEVANRTVLHLCASYSGYSAEAAAELTGGASHKEITRIVLFEAALKSNQVDVNAIDAYGRTPLHCAAIHNRRDFLNSLISAGADIDRSDNDNYGALHYSIFHGFIGCVEDLLDAGATTAGVDPQRSYVPLNFACQHGAYNSVVVLLKKRPHDMMVADAEGLYPLHIVARAGYASIIPLLVKAGGLVNEEDKLNGWTPLIYAASEGHPKAVAAFLAEHADWTALDEHGRSALFYAAWEGHTSCFKLLSMVLGPDKRDISTTGVEAVPENKLFEGMGLRDSVKPDDDDGDDDDFIEDGDEDDNIGGEIPELELPPPIMPLKRYGHNFLDAKKIIVQLRDIQFQFDKNRRGLSAGRLTLTSSSTRDSIPRNLAVPVPTEDHVQTFEVDVLDKFSLTFEVMPTFGTRMLAKAVAQAYVFGAEEGGELGRHSRQVQIPLVDLMLRPVGSLEFSYLVVKPYPGPPLEISKYDTYWKSTAQTPVPALSYVTASSLHGSYKRISVTLTRDLVPVVGEPTFELQGVSIVVPLFTLAELVKLKPGVITLEEWSSRATDLKVDLHVPFPTVVESRDVPVRWPAMNVCVDRILDVVFAQARRAGANARTIVFSSTHPEICAMLNWKQPNYPVLFCATAMRADGKYTTANRIETSDEPLGELSVCTSLREASVYAATNNLMGVVAPADILSVVPATVPAIRALGLVLVSDFGAAPGVDGVQNNDMLEFSRDIGM